MRRLAGEQLLRVLLAVVADAESLTAGWVLDDGPDAGNAALEVEMTARDDSPTSRTLARWSQARSRFAGFRLPGAALSSSVVASYQIADALPLQQVMAAVRVQACADIDRRASSPENAEAGKQLVGALLEVVHQTLAGGHIENVTSLMLAPEAATLVCASHVADGAKVEESLTRFIEAARRENPEFVNDALRREVDASSGVRFHTLTVDVPNDAENRERIVQALGESPQVVVGIGDQSVYLAAGRDARRFLQQAMSQSTRSTETAVAPMRLSWAARDTLRFVAAMGQTASPERTSRLLQRLSAVTDEDHVNLSVTPTPQGLRLRLECEQGALQVLQAFREKP